MSVAPKVRINTPESISEAVEATPVIIKLTPINDIRGARKTEPEV